MAEISKEKFVSSTLWKIMESISSKGISLIISIVLARILLPEDYGIVALTAVFINLTNIFVQSGLNTALIREKQLEKIDYSLVLYFSLAISTVFYGILFVWAPYIAGFYKEPLICPVLRVQMLSFFICSFGTVRNAIIVKEFLFKQLCIVSFISNTIGGIVGIILALNDFGVWALVFYTLSRDFLSNFLLLYIVKWKPVLQFSLKRLKALLSFSIWVLLASLLDFCGNNIYSIVFGKQYSVKELGYYSRGNQLPELVGLHTFGAISSVLLPTLANFQDNFEKLKQVVRKVTSLTCYIIFPMMGGLAVIGHNLVLFLFTSKWEACVPILWAASISFGINPIRSINIQLMYALGDSKKGMMIEIARFIMLIISLIIGIILFEFNMYEMCFIVAGIAVVVVAFTQEYVRKMVGYTYKELLHDIMPSIAITIIMCIIVYCIGKLELNASIILLIQVVSGSTVYIFLSAMFKVKCYYELKSIIKNLIIKRRTLRE